MRAALPVVVLIAGSLAGISAGQTASVPGSLEVTAAWGGISRPARMTEIRVRLSAPTAGRASLRIEAGPSVVESDVALTQQQAIELRIPVPASESIQVHAMLPGGARLDRDLTLRLAEAPLLALGVMALGSLPDEIVKTEIDAAGYPSRAAAYEAVDAIAIDAPTLSRLDHEQLEALIAYVGHCGPTIAIELPPETAALLRSEAGCGGRALLSAPAGLPAETIAHLLATAPRGPANAASLQTLLAPAPGPWVAVVASLAIYLAGGLLLALFIRKPAAILLYAVLATVLVPIAERAATGPKRLSVWAETESQDSRGRYAALVETTGTGHFVRSMQLPALLGDAEPCNSEDSDTRPRWSWDTVRARFSNVTFEQTLFGAATVCWRGAFPLQRAATMEPRGDALLVTNRGTASWPTGVAVRDGRLYSLPSIRAGGTGLLSGAALRDSPATDLAALRMSNLEGGLLWPLELPALGFTPDSMRAYLLLRCTGVGS